MEACSAPASRTVADLTAEARTEAGLTGAEGDIRTAAVSMEVEADRVTPAVVVTSVPVVRVEEAGTSVAGVVVDSVAVDSRVALRWGGRAVRDHLEVAFTAEARHAHRAAIRPAHTAEEATDDQATGTAADTEVTRALLTPMAAGTAEVPGLPTAIMATTELTAATTAQPAPAVLLMVEATLLRGRVAHTEARTETRTEIRDTVAATEQLPIAAIPE